jgi:hypothetical protein
VSYQKFFCPQCGYAIPEFITEIGDNGYHMQATCPRCKVSVQGIAAMPMMPLADDVGMS